MAAQETRVSWAATAAGDAGETRDALAARASCSVRDAGTQTFVERSRGGARATHAVAAHTTVSRSSQSAREAAAQTRQRFFAAEAAGGVTPRPWRGADADSELRAAAVTALQCALRARLAVRRAAALRAARAMREKAACASAAAAITELARVAAYEVSRRRQPRTPADFALLRREVDALRLAGTAEAAAAAAAEATAAAAAAARTRALEAVLADETAALRGIERLRGVALREADADGVSQRLAAAAAPRAWPVAAVARWAGSAAAAAVVAVETPATLRAAELAAVLAELRAGAAAAADAAAAAAAGAGAGAGASSDGAARAALLGRVTGAVQPHACALSREVRALAAREADALARRRPLAVQAGVRRRLATLFALFADADPGAAAGQPPYSDAPPQPLAAALALTRSLSTAADREPPPPPAPRERPRLRRPPPAAGAGGEPPSPPLLVAAGRALLAAAAAVEASPRPP
jgi:hypothetical protein